MRTTWWLLPLVVLLVTQAAGLAEEKTPILQTAGKLVPCPAPVVAPAPCVSGTCLPQTKSGSLCGRFRDWLFYRPANRGNPCGCCKQCTPTFVPPLYTFFLDHCQAGYCGGCAQPAAIAVPPAERN